MKIYVASSWRNEQQQEVVERLRAAGHEVYDFKNPPDRTGFSWSDVDPDWKQWTPEQYREKLQHPISQAGYDSDFNAMLWADACVLVLPCGRSAHAEAGWFAGAEKPVIALIDGSEPELMYKMFASICLSIDEVLQDLAALDAVDLVVSDIITVNGPLPYEVVNGTGSIMNEETRQKLIDAGREDLVRVHDINMSGYAGILSTGEIVDRREHPTAIPIQENRLLGIPAPKAIDQ